MAEEQTRITYDFCYGCGERVTENTRVYRAGFKNPMRQQLPLPNYRCLAVQVKRGVFVADTAIPVCQNCHAEALVSSDMKRRLWAMTVFVNRTEKCGPPAVFEGPLEELEMLAVYDLTPEWELNRKASRLD